MDALEKAVERTERREAMSRAVNKERERCARIAELFAVQGGGAEWEGKLIARRIADLIRNGPLR